jgi:hypothetical protein
MHYPQQTILIDGGSAIEPLGVEVNECTIPNKQSSLMGALQLNHLGLRSTNVLSPTNNPH